MTYACVVVGTDGSPTAETAVRCGAELASVDQARMVVVTAFEGEHRTAMDHLAGTDPGASSRRQSDVPADVRWRLTDRGQADAIAERGRAIARDGGAQAITILSDEGDPADVLLDAARLHDADLLVVGSVGLVGAERVLMGSVANTVLHHAPCDVLVVDTA